MSLSRQSKNSDDILIRTLALGFSRGHVIDGHSHQWSQLIFASQGVMQVDAQGNRWIVPPLRCLWMPANVVHTIRTLSETSLRTVYILPKLSANFPNECRVLNVTPLLRELLLETIRLGMLRRSTEEQKVFASVLVNQIKRSDEMPLKLKMPTDPRAIRLADIISSHPEKKINLAEAAKQTGASPRTLERLFKDETGMSVGNWRRQARLMFAIRMLSEGTPVGEVAFSCGFNSPSSFVKAFREELGETPGHFLRRFNL